MKLPSELRLMILSVLLVSKTRLSTRDEQQQTVCSDSQVVSRSGQLLLVCQQLYHESHNLLYGYNTLGINLFREYSNLNCDILNLQIDLPNELSDIGNPNFHLLEHVDTRLESSYGASPNIQALKSVYQALRQFQHYHVHISFYDLEEIFVASLFLRHLLANKHVTFTYAYQLHSVNGDDLDAVKEEPDALNGVTTLRCREFKFGTKPGNLPTYALATLERLEKKVMSNEAVDDNFRLWWSIENNVIKSLPHVRDYDFDVMYHDDLMELRTYLIKSETVAYRKKQEDIMKNIMPWNKDWAEDKSRDLEARLEAVKLYKDRSIQMLSTALEDNELELSSRLDEAPEKDDLSG